MNYILFTDEDKSKMQQLLPYIVSHI